MLGVLFGFKGRLSRPGYWEVLASIVLIDVLLLLAGMYVADSGLPGGFGPASPPSRVLLALTPWAFVVFTAWSLLAAMVKRCHDRSRSGAMVLVGLIPVIGWLWLFVDLFLLEGVEGRNRYGRPPHSHAPEGAAEARTRFDWGAEPAAAHEPPFAAAPSEPPAPEPPAAEPVQAHVDTVDVYVPEHLAPEPEPAPEAEPAPLALAAPDAAAEPVALVEPQAPAEPEAPIETELAPATLAAPAAEPEAEATAEPGPPPVEAAEPAAALAETSPPNPVPEEAAAEPETQTLEIMPAPPPAPAPQPDPSRSDSRPLVLDRV